MYDIVGSLPLELLAQVVEYLDLEDIFRSQRVSKQWRTIFSCDTIIKPILRQTLAFLGLDQEGVSTDAAMADAMNYFRWRYNLEHARPIKRIFLPWPTDFPYMPVRIDCRSRRLCYTTPKSSQAEIINLETGKKSTWPYSHHHLGYVQFVMLSDRYLVTGFFEMWSGMYDMTAYDIRTERKLNQQIPPVYYLETIVEDKVVFNNDSKGKPCSFYVWDLSSNHVQQIGSFSKPVLYHVEAADNVLVAFEVNWKKLPPNVQQTKWRMETGQLLAKKTFHLPLPPDLPVNGQFDTMAFYRCHAFGHKSVNQLFLVTDTCSTIHLEYDYAADRLNVRWIRTADLLNLADFKIYLTPYLIYFCTSETSQVAVYNATTSTVTLHQIQIRRRSSNWILQKFRKTGDQRFVKVFGDREVFGLANEAGVELWFFNPNFVPNERELECLKRSMLYFPTNI
ncbi:hypothetical protein VTN49DRAFT_7953 [Thermomyces lanuginosus]|uniref:uncharacterized protein n=1 Tax=Thermomyces lanuginosus TaxID=5541 RepID=UPI00374405D3